MKPYYSDELVTLYHGDCRDVLPTIDGADLVVTDPPYVFGLASTAQEGKAGGWGDLMNSAMFYAWLLREFHRLVVNRNGAAWVFNSWRSFPVLARASFEAQWPIESLMIWDKQWIGPGGQRGLRPSYEQVALFVCGEFAIADRGCPDVWQCQWSSLKPNGHSAEKPLALVQRIVRESGGGIVVDAFAGSGTTLVAAKTQGHRAIGIEIEERWCESAAKRLSQGSLTEMFA